ncbi:WGR domain-containing protein [Acidisoma cellulosilytica]|uniref:WGR domain-containing protein n=1 Tax=Acidisoma cellulosilyticum TaxID=2802395 RepID=A0A963Z7C7_9PROT|nr:WGR domain-containing protein [Acidisoma cellulosilyticum]MCB8883918.1 WGR domain-containing protein [Acidisoma cellulosilyticum]
MDTVSVSLRRVRPFRNERRFYRLEVSLDLFGTLLLCRRWGRIGTDGQLRCDAYPDRATAAAALARHADRKRRRGYDDWADASQSSFANAAV